MFEDEVVEYMREGVNLLVETQTDEETGETQMAITHMDLSPSQVVHMIQFLTERLEMISGISYNQILEDLKYTEEIKGEQ